MWTVDEERQRNSIGKFVGRVGELTTQQLRFLSVRLTVRTDKEAAEAIGVSPYVASKWKTEEPAFLARYNAMWTDGVDLAMDYSRKLLGRATAALEEGLDAVTESGRTDYRTRHDVAKTVLTIHGVLRQRVDIALVRQEAERLAREYALDPDELLAEAEQISRARALPAPAGET